MLLQRFGSLKMWKGTFFLRFSNIGFPRFFCSKSFAEKRRAKTRRAAQSSGMGTLLISKVREESLGGSGAVFFLV